MTVSSEFLEKWQTLIGAGLGTFLGFILSSFSSWISSKIKNKKERKESLRQIEVNLTRSLNDIYNFRRGLKIFVDAIERLSNNSISKTDENTFFLNRINFPSFSKIHRDLENSNRKTRSYYLHNNLNFIDAGIKQINTSITDFKSDFENIFKINELLATLAKNKENISNQKKVFASNLKNFKEALEKYISENLQKSIIILTKAKVYNDHLRKPWGFLFWWKNEGLTFKFFKNKNSYRKFTRNLDSLDRIDKLIEKEVVKRIKEAEKRESNLNN